MISGFPLSILLIIIIVLFYILDFYFMSAHDVNRKQEGKGWSWDYTLFTIILSLLVVLQPVFLPMIGLNMNSTLGAAIQIAGGVSVFLSFVIHAWARLHLKHFYTERVEIQPDHKVINTGPYGLMRHPIITSFFLLSGGIFLLNPAVTTLFIVAYTIFTFTKSAIEEEKALSENVPGYKEYLKSTPRFLPRIWKK